MTPDGMERPAYAIDSVDNALRIILMLRDRPRLRVTDASRELGVARSTAHRVFAMLAYHELLVQEPKSRAYTAGPALLEVGLAAVANIDVRAAARPVLEQLSAEVGETVHLVIAQGANVLFVDSVESSRGVTVSSRLGDLIAAHRVAAGKALLAELSTTELRVLYPHERLVQETRRSLRTRSALERELTRVRRDGYATNRGEHEEGVIAIGVAIQDRRGDSVAGLSIATPEHRWTDHREQEFVDAAHRAAFSIGEILP